MQKLPSFGLSPKYPPYAYFASPSSVSPIFIPWSANSQMQPPIKRSSESKRALYAARSPGPLPIAWQYSHRKSGWRYLGSFR